MIARKTPDVDRGRSGVLPIVMLWRFLAGDRLRVGLAMVVYLVKHSPIWGWPILVGWIIEVIGNPSQHSLTEMWIYAGILFVWAAQNIPTHMLYAALFSRANRNLEARLRSSLISRLQQLSISFHDETRSGRLQAKVLRDAEAVHRLAGQIVDTIFTGIAGILFALVWALYHSPPVALFYLVAAPAALLLMHFFRKQIRERNRLFRMDIESMSGMVSEMIEMIPIARAHAVEKEEIRRMDDKLEQVKDRGYRLDIINNLFGCINWVVFKSFHLSCLVVTGYLAYNRRMSIGDVVMYLGLFEMIMQSIRMMLQQYPMIALGFESLHSIGEVLECPDIEQNRGKAKVGSVEGKFVFENVDFTYSSSEIASVRDFSLEIQPGESVALVGESGAGKTTIVNLAIGFYRPTGGRILLDGRDMQELDLRSYRKHLSVVTQDTILFSGSVRENIAYGFSDIDDDRIWEAIRVANASDFVEALPHALDTTIGEHGAKLSGGQRQRIAIARALIRNPKVIIFDEATSALDVSSELLVQEAIERLMEDRTTFVVAHRLSTIRKCDRIIVMKDGRCVETGTHDELMDARGEFHHLKSLQM